MEWPPATVEQVREIVAKGLVDCDSEQEAAFRKYAIEPHQAPILRNGNLETVVVVAPNSIEVMHWEDVEEGFNVSPVAPDGTIMEH